MIPAPYWANAMTAAWLSMVFFYVPQPNYWEIAMARHLRSNVLPRIPGV